MGKKKGGGKKGGGKKKKGPEFYTGEEDLGPFGFKLSPKGSAAKPSRHDRLLVIHNTRMDPPVTPSNTWEVNDIVCTPIGLKGIVIGVKYDPPGPENRDSAQLWVEYSDGKRAPLEPKLQSGFIGQAAGYRRVSEAEHIWRDVTNVRKTMEAEEQARAAAMEKQKLRAEALALEAAATEAKKAAAAAKKAAAAEAKAAAEAAAEAAAG